MPEQVAGQEKPRWPRFWHVPLFRLLAINLAAGAALAAVLVGGLLVLNPYSLRDLILADSAPGTALGLLLFGFVVTFGSAAMGTAIMMAGQRPADHEGPRGPPRLVPQRGRPQGSPQGRPYKDRHDVGASLVDAPT